MRPRSVLRLPKKPNAGSTEPAVSASSFAKPASPRAASKLSRHSVFARFASPWTRAQIEKDVDRKQIAWVRAADPVRDARAPGRQRAAPLRILGHDAARAIRHADLVQNVRHVNRERLEPEVLAPARGRLQRRPAHCPDPSRAGFRRGPPSRAPPAHRDDGAAPCPLAIIRCSAMTAARRVNAPSSREITAAMSRPADPFGQQPGGDMRQLRPGGAETRRVRRLVDLVAERDGFSRAHAQKIARRKRADDMAVIVGNAEMADSEAAHPRRARGR